MSAAVRDAAETSSPRRYARGRARRVEILDAAAALFADVGFGAVSLREIAARVGISHQGLLRHFASKDEVLVALLDRYETENAEWIEGWLDAHTGSGSGSGENREALFIALADRNDGIPGYVELFTALAGEATSAEHPAHERFAARYAQLRELSVAQFSSPVVAGLAAREIETVDEAVRLAAAWDGLQLQSLYEPDSVRVSDHLRAHFAWLVGDGSAATAPGSGGKSTPGLPATSSAASAWPADQTGDEPDASAGYASGRARRDRIVDDAMDLFSRGGFTATSVQDVADRVGITKSALLYHFRSKDELLLAVLQRRDRLGLAQVPAGTVTASRRLELVVEGARHNTATPGLVELYCVLAGESTNPGHPGHDFFRERFRGTRAFFAATFTELIASGELPESLDADREAAWLLALWDGLQFQWLYDRGSVDIAEQLSLHLAAVRTR